MAMRIPLVMDRTLHIAMPIRWEQVDGLFISGEAAMHIHAGDDTMTYQNNLTTLGSLDPITTANVSSYTMTELGGS